MNEYVHTYISYINDTETDINKLGFGFFFYKDIIFVFYLYTGEAENPGGARVVRLTVSSMPIWT